MQRPADNQRVHNNAGWRGVGHVSVNPSWKAAHTSSGRYVLNDQTQHGRQWLRTSSNGADPHDRNTRLLSTGHNNLS